MYDFCWRLDPNLQESDKHQPCLIGRDAVSLDRSAGCRYRVTVRPQSTLSETNSENENRCANFSFSVKADTQQRPDCELVSFSSSAATRHHWEPSEEGLAQERHRASDTQDLGSFASGLAAQGVPELFPTPLSPQQTDATQSTSHSGAPRM